MSAQNSVDNGAVVKLEVILTQYRETLAGTENYSAGSRGQLTRKYLHQGRFSRAVSADDAIAMARGECEIHILEEHALSKLHAQVISLYHCLKYFLSLGQSILWRINELNIPSRQGLDQS